MIKVKRIFIGITKLQVLSRKIIFSNPHLRNDLKNGKLLHKFVSHERLLYELLLVKSDCVVTVTMHPIAYSICSHL